MTVELLTIYRNSAKQIPGCLAFVWQLQMVLFMKREMRENYLPCKAYRKPAP